MSLHMPDESEKATAQIGALVGGIVTGLYSIVQWIADDGTQHIGILTAPGQTQVTSQGLLTVANAVADTELAAFILDTEDTDDE